MKKKKTICILGNGRIARAVLYYLKPFYKVKIFDSIKKDPLFEKCDLFVGALAGGIGEECLKLALYYKKHLVDISDVDPPFYLKMQRKIKQADITVIPGCGFSPGLVNCVLGKELDEYKGIEAIEIKAGSLARKSHYFPFLWCFEDLILEHQIPSWQVLSGKKRKCAPFAEYQSEQYYGIPAESYFCASGFENIFNAAGVNNFTCRVIRPKGFKEFFSFLKNQGFLKKEHLLNTRDIVQAYQKDNFTLAEVVIAPKRQRIIWEMKSFSKKQEPLNSMQKITASVPASIATFILEGWIKQRGLMFMEELGKDRQLFRMLVNEVRKCGIVLKRKSLKNKKGL